MKFSDWWQDKRYLQERTLVVGTVVVLLLLSLVVGLLIYLRPLPEETLAQNAASPEAAPTPIPAPEPAKKTAIELAADLVIAGRLVEAERILNGEEIALLRLRGAIAWKKNNLLEAARCFRAAVKIDPRSVADLCNLAGVQLQLNDAPAAVVNLRVAHEVDSGDVFLANRLFLARIQAGEINNVAAEVTNALKAAPETSLPSIAAAAAAIELQRGNPAMAAKFLHAAQGCLAPEVFESLLAEAPLAAFSSEAAIAPFYLRQEPASGSGR